MFPKLACLGQSCSFSILPTVQPASGQACPCLRVTARFTGQFTMKTTRNNNSTSTRYGNVVKIGSFVHTDKCGVLNITHARDHTSYTYELSSCTLQRNDWFGVSLTSRPGLPKRKNVVNKANTEIAGFRKWNVRPGNKEVFSRLYKALVISILGSRWAGACNSYTRPMSRHFYRLMLHLLFGERKAVPVQ